MDGWMDGWMDEDKSFLRDCLEQTKNKGVFRPDLSNVHCHKVMNEKV
jgi:hypothetical protein